MKTTTRKTTTQKIGAAAALRIVACLSIAIATSAATGVPAFAAPPSSTTHKTFIQRHHKLASAAAGIAAYKVAKSTGKRRAAAGGKRNFAQRHPVLTGVGAAMVTNHEIKKSAKH